MRASVATRYAVRSLGRNLRRTLLSCIGIGIGVAVGLITIGWISGEKDLFVHAAAESGAGHLRIVPSSWPTRHDPMLRLEGYPGVLHVARSFPGVTVATPRARAQALLAMGNHVASVEMVGVDPRTEPKTLRLVRHITKGRYLRPDDRNATVMGKALADQLHSEIGDSLVVTVVQKGGGMESAMLDIVGIVDTGSRDIDLGLCQVTLPEMDKLSGQKGAGEVTMMLAHPHQLETVRDALARKMPKGDTVVTWYQVAPELEAGVGIDEAWGKLTVFIVLFVVFLGVASAQLTGVLERRKEFAVLSAIGMRGPVMVRLVLIEGLALGIASTLVALAIGVPVVWYLAVHGVDMRSLMGDNLAISGVLVDPVFHANMGAWIVPDAVLLSVLATVLASIYPAWFAARTDPASALRVAQ